MARKTEATVDTPSAEWTLMERYRQLPRDLRGGVLKLRECADEHLWRSPRERDHDYQRRLNALRFDPLYWSAMEHLGGQPFTRQLEWSDDAPEVLQPAGPWANDVDGFDRDLRQVMRASCITSVGMGLMFVLVTWDADDGRPYLVEIPSEDVLDPWEEGAPVRIRMSIVNRDEAKPWIKWHEDQIWALYDGEPTAGGLDRYARWEVYEREKPKDPKSPFREEPKEELSGYFSPQEFIPLFPIYTGTGVCGERLPWVSVPPLYDTAEANRVLLNKQSDLDYGLHIGNVPQRAASGLTEDEAKKIDTVSHKGLWYMTEPRGRFYFVEHTGASFEISMKDLERLTRQIEVASLQPLVSDDSGVTATGRMIDLSRATTTAQAWTLGWQDSWNQVLHAMARYARLPDRFTVGLFTAFGPAPQDLERAKLIQKDYLEGDLEPELYYPEMKRLGVYGEAFDADRAATAARKRQDEEMKRLLTMPVPGGGRVPTDAKADEAEDQPDLTQDAA